MGGTRASEDPEVTSAFGVRAAVATSGRPGEDPILGRYVPGRRLGSGGFGTVYEAEDLRLGRTVALKLIDGAVASPERARREAMAAGRLDHPGIVAVFDAGDAGGARFLVSELVRGRTLAELEAEGALSDRDVLRVGLALADALAHAHARGVVHRDVKPQNVIVPDEDADGGASSWRAAAKLADFGIASLAGDESLTQTGDIVGTLAYMAPEQASGDHVDDRADLYALSLVLYEGLSGIHPVRAGSPAATARRVGTVLPSLRRHRRDLPPAVCAAIDVALQPDPARRGELADLADALADALTEVSDDGGTIAPHPLERERRSLPRGVGRLLAGAAAGGLVGGALAMTPIAAPGTPVLAALGIAALTAAMPRAGWLIGAVVILVTLGSAPAPGPAVAMLAGAAVLAVPILLLRHGLAWSVPALAPLLGLLSIGPVYAALAGRTGSVRSRAGLGAAGALWLLLAEPVIGRELWPGSIASPALDGASGRPGATAAVDGVLVPLVVSGALALVALWAVAATVLPWLVRGRSAGADAVAAILWAAALAAGTALVAEVVRPGEPAGPAGLVGSAAAAALVAAWRRR